MKRLSTRLILAVVAASVISAALLDVAALFFLARRATHERNARLDAATYAAAHHLRAPGAAARSVVDAVAAQFSVSITLIDATDKTRLSSQGAPAVIDAIITGDASSHIAAGYEHRSRLLYPDGSGEPQRWRAVVASLPLSAAVDQALEANRAIVPLLAVGVLITALLSLAFLRRSITQPIARMTALAAAADYARIAALEGETADDLGALARAIAAMTRAIDEDRNKISTQLAELEQAHADLAGTQRQLVRAERLAVVGQLAAGLAHEIGNPLAVLTGYVEVLLAAAAGRSLKPVTQEKQREILERMGRELDRIQQTVRELLDFSRASDPPNAALALPANGDVADAFAHLEGLLRPQQKMSGIELRIVKPALPLHVALPTDALLQVLLNLCLNAADALSEAKTGGAARIELRSETRAEQVRITVDDNGPGVPQQLRARLFDPFYTTKPPGEGTGLGLAVCERIIASAGGDIAVDDNPSGGARFTIDIPAAPAR